MFSHFNLAGFSILLAAAPLFSEQAADDAELPAVVVSSTRLTDVEVSPDRVPSKVTVVTAKEIKSKGARTVQEALQYLGGVTLYDQIGNSFQSAFDMRGFNGQPVPSTSVFVDGIGCSHQWNHDCPWFRIRRRIINGDFIVQRLWTHARQTFCYQ